MKKAPPALWQMALFAAGNSEKSPKNAGLFREKNVILNLLFFAHSAIIKDTKSDGDRAGVPEYVPKHKLRRPSAEKEDI